MRTINNNPTTTAGIEPIRKSVFEMSAEELSERLRPTAEMLTQEAWDNNSYIVYFDENYALPMILWFMSTGIIKSW